MLNLPTSPPLAAKLLMQLLVRRSLGGPGSGNFGHAGRPGERGGSSSSGVELAVRSKGKSRRYVLRPTTQRAFGDKKPSTERLSKLETGALGEDLAVQFLKDQGFEDARTLNVVGNNFPVDLVQDHEVYEVKTGLASNGPGAQQWRATIGQPGVKEQKWLAKATPEQKAKWNERKTREILQRKQEAVKEVSKVLGRSVKPKTMALIVDPGRRVVDVHVFDGFHSRVGWSSKEAAGGYRGSYRY